MASRTRAFRVQKLLSFSFPRDPEDLLYTLVLQCRYEQLSPVHRMRSRSFDVSIGVRSECRALKSNIELLDFDHTN